MPVGGEDGQPFFLSFCGSGESRVDLPVPAFPVM